MPAFCPIGERASLAFSRSRLVGSHGDYPRNDAAVIRAASPMQLDWKPARVAPAERQPLVLVELNSLKKRTALLPRRGHANVRASDFSAHAQNDRARHACNHNHYAPRHSITRIN